jgi:hypothetical protein
MDQSDHPNADYQTSEMDQSDTQANCRIGRREGSDTYKSLPNKVNGPRYQTIDYRPSLYHPLPHRRCATRVTH